MTSIVAHSITLTKAAPSQPGQVGYRVGALDMIVVIDQ
jgi:hypothetical protein